MKEEKLINTLHSVYLVLKSIFWVLLLLLSIVVILGGSLFFSGSQRMVYSESPKEEFVVVDGVHLETGLIDSPGVTLVINNCTTCHSAQLIIQNKMKLEGWKSTIRWMQETQNLWDLGENEQTILEYLALNYGPDSFGRRKNLENIEWYQLRDQ